jgi:uncharacterized protein YecE (DUF72 family)
MLHKEMSTIKRIGTAGWNIPSSTSNSFPPGDTLLERYSKVFNVTEINSSFYRSHKITTYERWAAATPANFLFSVKTPKEITHDHRLVDITYLLDQFLNEITGLADKLGPVLIQLPPSLNFETKIASQFFKLMRNKFTGRVVLEPRHISWSELTAMAILNEYNIEYVIADPVVVPIAAKESQFFKYYRLHGSPKIYSSSYDLEFLKQLDSKQTSSSWVIFDNSTLGAATKNSLDLNALL